MPKSNDAFSLPKLIQSSLIFEKSLIRIRCDRLQIEDKQPYDYYSLITPPFAVAILPISKSGEYILIEEYRHPTAHVLLGCPCGFLEKGEDPLKGAERELLEETGFHAESFEIIGSAYPYAGFSGQKTIYVRAQKAILSRHACLEPSEVIRPCILSPNELEMAISQGAELDGTLCTALFFHNRR